MLVLNLQRHFFQLEAPGFLEALLLLPLLLK